MKRLALTLTISLSAMITVSADNWPQWRGPSLNGVSGEKNLPVKWGPDENVSWKLPMPSRSGSTPIVWNDVVVLNVALQEKEGDLELWAVDRAGALP